MGHYAVQPTFSAAEMERRLTNIRKVMSDLGIDAALFSSYHNINYFSDFMFCYFGRRYGLVVDHNIMTSISAGIDGGQPWRRTYGGKNVTYTDWQKDNYFHAIRQLTGGVKRLGIEFDHITIDTLNLLKSEFPNMEFVDIAAHSMRLRMIKSAEEIAHIEKMTRIADIGGGTASFRMLMPQMLFSILAYPLLALVVSRTDRFRLIPIRKR
mgnify:CR=1 FL=1